MSIFGQFFDQMFQYFSCNFSVWATKLDFSAVLANIEILAGL